MFIADSIQDYKILDTGDGMKLETWGDYMLARPDPQVIWEKEKPQLWRKADAVYSRSSKGGGAWEFKNRLPESWKVNVGGLKFIVRPTGFKHTGLFPEQSANWAFMQEQLQSRPGAKVLNLFAYTGGATLACAAAGAQVVHVDAAKGMVQWAKENAAASGLADRPIRWIVDDCAKFVEREIRRGRRYDAVIMDPPSYGRGPSGEIWKLEENLYPFLELVAGVLSDKPLFFLVNSYTTGLAPSVLTYMLETLLTQKYGGHTESDELGLPATASGLILPCGAAGRWTAQ